MDDQSQPIVKAQQHDLGVHSAALIPSPLHGKGSVRRTTLNFVPNITVNITVNFPSPILAFP